MFEPTAIEGVLQCVPRRHEDERGYFSETFRQSWLEAAGVQVVFVQENLAFSRQAGVLRGLHYQSGAAAQGKLVRVSRGAIFDVAVDLRPGSATHGRHVTFELTAANGRQAWIPPGFAHGYLTTEPDTEVVYKTTAYYDPKAEGGIAFDDPDLGIAWPMAAAGLIVSPRDRGWRRLGESQIGGGE
ncbi:dTDP-4-dehydrorhamnose 3,5-epimerase [Alphaproteobacteria bacterium SO-S41]|nr:dTDP-4-dehydrorhamnose 3,5-epimerase [Alphaproteobacteria bacterium SO-S41]